MTQTPGEPVTRPTPTSVAAAAPFEEVHPAPEQPASRSGRVGSRRSRAGLAALAGGAAAFAALVVRRRAAGTGRH